jgi:hypothetical protein
VGRRVGRGFARGRNSGLKVQGQERIAFRAGTAGTPDLHRETHDEKPRQAGGNEDRQRENVHGREDVEKEVHISSPECGKGEIFAESADFPATLVRSLLVPSFAAANTEEQVAAHILKSSPR